MPYYDEIFKHVAGKFPKDLAVLALKTSELEVGDRLTPSVKSPCFSLRDVYQIREVETQPEHVHLLIEIPPTDSVDKIVGKIKGYTSKVLREEYPSLKSRLPSLWTRSKFVSSCGDVTLKVIKDYIEGQSGQ